MLRFAAPVGADADFLQFASSASESVVDYWRGLLAELEERRGLTAYHLEVLPPHPTPRRARDATWCVTVVYDTAQSAQQRAGPIDATQCMSCDLDCLLSVGVGSGETQLTSRDTAVAEYAHHRAWLDAKARPMLVLTPNRHVRRLAQLSDEELAEFWCNAAQLLHAEGLTWDRMVLNHGDFQNHAHLHLKIRVPKRHWSQAVERWPPARRALWSRLQEYRSTLGR